MFSSDTTQVADGGYQISRSLRFNSADSAYLNRTPASAGNQSTWTLSFWIKRGAIGSANTGVFYQQTAANDTGYFDIVFPTSDTLVLEGWTSTWRVTNQVFRDASAWYHIVVAVDTTQATANNRIRLYVNGSEVTSFSTTNNPTQNSTTGVNGTGPAGVGRTNTNYFNGYMTEIYMVDGQQLTPSSFGQTDAQTGVWTPIAYSGSYGTNGFYLNFSDNSNTTAATLGKDYSGNGNNWTPNNFSVTAGAGNDSLVDSPTSYGTDTGAGGTVRGNYATWNPLDTGSSSFMSTSNGNLAATLSVGGWIGIRGTIGVSSDKWYWEVTCTNNHMIVGIMKASASLTSGTGYPGGDTNGWGYAQDNGYKYNGGSSTAYGATYAVNDVIGIAFDADAGTLTFYKNGTSQGTAFTGLTSGPYFPAVGLDVSTAYINTGQRPFAYTAPSGYKALCTQNLPTPTIGATTATQAGKYFAPVTYTATGNDPLAITGVGFQPDFVWIKARSQARDNVLFDAVRGATKYIVSNSTSAEATNAGSLKSFDSDGFTLGNSFPPVNWTSGDTQVSWNWKANGSGSTNTAGSITSTVSANTTSGFSVVTWTGNSSNATIGHGLGVAPSMVIIKYRGTTDNWYVYNSNVGTNKYLVLNATDAAATSTSIWQNTAPTSTVFSIGGGNNNSTIVAYCFAPIAGYSAFGSYTGNGSADGPFVFTGFRPAFVMTKRTDLTSDWTITDLRRPGYNLVNKSLYANQSSAELTYNVLDQVSNGFKLRDADGIWNGSGGTYIFMAFAENPFKYSLAR